MGKPRICIVPEYPVSLMTGGTLVQAAETRRALAVHQPDMHFELFNWSEVETPADCYHFIGLPKSMAGICSRVAQVRRPYVLTLLMGSDRAGGSRMAAWRRRVSCWLRWSHEHQYAIESASGLVSLTSWGAEAMSVIFRVPLKRIHVVPVAVSEVYFGAKPDLWRTQFGSDPFVLCVGAIQQRKNQLLLARMCNQLRLPLVLVGSILNGENTYAESVQLAMKENERQGGRWLRCDDTLLASAYAACQLFVLLSTSETQPASVLQAMALGKPVLLADAPYARRHPFDRLARGDCRDESRLMATLKSAWNEAASTQLPPEFTWPHVCKMLTSIYSSLLKK